MLGVARKQLAALAVSACVAAAALSATSAAQQIGPGPDGPLEPAIAEIEVDWLRNGKLRLRADIFPRGAEVERVTFRYRRKLFRANEVGKFKYARVVEPRGDDGRGDNVRFRVRACTATRCAARTDSDKAD